MKKFIIKTLYSYNDKNFNYDFLNMKLIDESECVIMDGDYYHDKIVQKIEGFFECLDYLGIEYQKEEINETEGE